ncbi:M12 family metallopeptidase [Elizabethkingia anophelis]|uniref:M12 family metallopeptidase n=1 Tax=Elizabethkingia anophelis TaxID=1117645 RepID=UPI000B361DE1|nr:M12 family metallopeptidase [Elizabethkingia anophelis]
MKKTLFLLLISILITSCKNDIDDNSTNQSKTIENNELITLKSGIVVEKRGDLYIFGGDMILSSLQLKSLDEKGNLLGDNDIPEDKADTSIHPVFNLPMSTLEGDNKTLPRNLGINANSYRLWAMVRFTYGASILNHPNRDMFQARIRKAMQQIQSQTNVRFYNATGQPTVDPTWGFAYPYIEMNYVGGIDVSTSSGIGRNPSGGRQFVNLANFAFPPFDYYNVPVIVHELLHAIGMMHEQNRPDRDSYVTINTSNLTPAGRGQFQKISTNYSYIGGYDYNSVMGYSSYTSSSSMVYDTSKPMYTKKDQSSINQGEVLSNLDRIWLNNYHLPYIARSDVYRELDEVVYGPNNTVLTANERRQLQARINNGNPNPPSGGRIPNNL